MPPRRVFPALLPALLTAVLLMGGCGSDEDGPAAAAVGTSAAPGPSTPSSTAPPTAPSIAPTAAAPGAGDRAEKPARSAAAATVAPEVVLPSTTDSRSQAARTGWEGTVIFQLRRIDPRLVTREAAVISKVRATCDFMSTGAFETRVLPVIVQRFSNAKIRVSEEMARGIYAVLLQDACYVISNSADDDRVR